jgi:protein-S-isoprenylcysteine O-methyltransferase Ste14
VVWRNPGLLVLVSVVVVVIVLFLKMRIEEVALRGKFKDYETYSERVPALVPFLPRWIRRLLSRAGLPS